MLSSVELKLANEDETMAIGRKVSALLLDGLDKVAGRALCIKLDGDLGAGKTTFTRGILRAFNYEKTVKSPTYNIVECYHLEGVLEAKPFDVFHFDLYRLRDPWELEMMGIRDYFAKRAICLIEWPQYGGDFLPNADLNVKIEHQGDGRLMNLSSELFSLDELKSLSEIN